MGPIQAINEALCSDAARLIIAVLLVVGVLALLLTSKEVPEFLAVLLGAVVGFYYGGQGRP